MKSLIITTILILICFVSYSQKTQKGISTARKLKVNFKEMAALEEFMPKRERPYESANEEEEEEGRRVDLPVETSDTKPFTGKEYHFNANTTNAPQVVSTCNNFRAIDDNNNSRPPDTHGGVGFDHIMTVLNTEIRIQDKQGNNLSTMNLATFWSGTGHTDIFDPKVVYDPYNQRWIFVVCATRKNINSALLVAVSDNFDPTGGWTIYDFDADPADQRWFDYPSLGFNNNWIAVGGNMFDNPGGTDFARISRVFVIDKLAAYNGTLTGLTFFDDPDYFTICPAFTYSSSESTLWCVSVHNSNSNGAGIVRLFAITGTGSNPAFNLTNLVNIGSAWSSTIVNAPQSGSTTGLDLGDDRFRQAVVRNGRLWFSGNIFLPASTPTYAGIQYAAITLSNATTAERGIFSDNTGAVMYGYPTVCVNSVDDLALGFTFFTTSGFPGAAVAYRSSGVGGFNVVVYKGGEDWYVKLADGVNRWGDYSATCIDPEDDKTMWTIQEYSRPRVMGTSYWGTWWSKVCNQTCSADLTLGGTIFPGVFLKSEAVNTITSTSIILSGAYMKYDAGTRIRLSPGFRANNGARLKIYVDGCGGTR